MKKFRALLSSMLKMVSGLQSQERNLEERIGEFNNTLVGYSVAEVSPFSNALVKVAAVLGNINNMRAQMRVNAQTQLVEPIQEILRHLKYIKELKDKYKVALFLMDGAREKASVVYPPKQSHKAQQAQQELQQRELEYDKLKRELASLLAGVRTNSRARMLDALESYLSIYGIFFDDCGILVHRFRDDWQSTNTGAVSSPVRAAPALPPRSPHGAALTVSSAGSASGATSVTAKFHSDSPAKPLAVTEVHDPARVSGVMLKATAYETLLMSVDMKALTVSADIVTRTFRVQMKLSSRQHAEIMEHMDPGDILTADSNPFTSSTTTTRDLTETIERWDVRTRLALLLRYGPTTFNDIDAFTTWQSRQVAVLVAALHSVITSLPQDQTVSVAGRDITPHDARKTIVATAAVITPAVAQVPLLYEDTLQRLRCYIDDVYAAQTSTVSPCPLPLGSDVYEELLMCSFDDEGARHHSADQMAVVLMEVQRKLLISQETHCICWARCLLRKFMEFRLPALLHQLRDTLSQRHATSAQYTAQVAQEIGSYVRRMTSDYHRYFLSQPDMLPDAIAVLQLVDNNVDIGELVRSSAQNFYQRITQAYPRPMPLDHLISLCEGLAEELEGEATLFAPVLSKYASDTAQTFAAGVMAWFYADFNASMGVIPKGELPEQALEVRRGVEALQRKLLTHNLLAEDRLIDVEHTFDPLRVDWIAAQRYTYATILDRILRAESWQPADATSWHTAGVVDLFALLHQSLPVFFRVMTPNALHINELNSIAHGLIANYCTAITDVCIPRDRMVPGAVVRTESGVLLFKRKVETVVYNFAPDVATSLAQHSLNQLLLRLGNLSFCIDQIQQLRDKRLQMFHPPADDRAGCDAADEFLGPTRQCVEAAFMKLMDFIASRAIQYDLRPVFLNTLYIPQGLLGRGGLHAALQSLDQIMSVIMPRIPQPFTQVMLAALLGEMVAVLIRVLTEDSPSRKYDPSDSDIFTRDLKLLRDYFIAADADGKENGLKSSVTDEILQPLRQLVGLTATGSAELQALYATTAADTVGSVINKTTIAKVLGTRSDKSALQFVKKLNS
eukprot:TRINITY_DN5468_c0_g3_i3.p1 TRINITY_DN5468_c0_g3~~TRINITY_DN5468_c0_g3_i3.p1  ORF type:complete len:1074 (-),score=233.11 TRINITY_DN5468_c0_g3_i3:258-3479(-)